MSKGAQSKAAMVQALRYHFKLQVKHIAEMLDMEPSRVSRLASETSNERIDPWWKRIETGQAKPAIDKAKDLIQKTEAVYGRPITEIFEPDRRRFESGDCFMARSQLWERCNRCGYYFQKKESGDVDGQDVIRHKREECASNR